jgi:hypothetical protein
MIIAIPMPIFIAAKLATRRKVILVGVFALGIFTVCHCSPLVVEMPVCLTEVV